MTEHGHDDEPEPRPESPGIGPASSVDLSLAAMVERERAMLEAEGRTMADWLDRIVPIPAMEPGWAARTVRELRDSDDVPKPRMKAVLRDMDQHRRPDGPTSEEIVEDLHEGREERDQQLDDPRRPT